MEKAFVLDHSLIPIVFNFSIYAYLVCFKVLTFWGSWNHSKGKNQLTERKPIS